MMLFPTTHDPIEEDPFVIEARAEEAAREQRWTTFVSDLRRWHESRSWSAIVEEASWGMDGDVADGSTMCNFAETEGWHGVLTAIARAMREAEQAQQELMDRR